MRGRCRGLPRPSPSSSRLLRACSWSAEGLCSAAAGLSVAAEGFCSAPRVRTGALAFRSAPRVAALTAAVTVVIARRRSVSAPVTAAAGIGVVLRRAGARGARERTVGGAAAVRAPTVAAGAPVARRSAARASRRRPCARGPDRRRRAPGHGLAWPRGAPRGPCRGRTSRSLTTLGRRLKKAALAAGLERARARDRDGVGERGSSRAGCSCRAGSCRRRWRCRWSSARRRRASSSRHGRGSGSATPPGRRRDGRPRDASGGCSRVPRKAAGSSVADVAGSRSTSARSPASALCSPSGRSKPRIPATVPRAQPRGIWRRRPSWTIGCGARRGRRGGRVAAAGESAEQQSRRSRRARPGRRRRRTRTRAAAHGGSATGRLRPVTTRHRTCRTRPRAGAWRSGRASASASAALGGGVGRDVARRGGRHGLRRRRRAAPVPAGRRVQAA